MKQLHLIITVIFIGFAKPDFAQTNLSGVLLCNTTLGIGGSPYYVVSTITVSPGCILTVNAGVEIKMAENTHIIVKGKVNFSGTVSQPIYIHAKDTTWGNILLDSTLTQKSTFDYVIIENARRSVKTGQEPGAIYGYYSALEIKNCHFKNNLRCVSNYQCPNFIVKDCILDSTNTGEKIHGQYCNGSLVDGNILYATRGDCDGIDFDASNNVAITNNSINSGDDDAIDIGQCDSIGCNGVTVSGNCIFNMFNKGVSNGEYCLNINIHHNVIVGCGMGIGAKSGAHVVADHNTLYKNHVGISSYEHLNQIWGPGHLTVTNCIIADSDTTWKKDPTAYLLVAYTLSNNTLIPGTGNIMGNPSFISPGMNSSANFHLNPNSPAINSGDPSFALDPDGSRTDMGAFYAGMASVQSVLLSNVLTVFPNPTKGIFHVRVSDSNFFTNASLVRLKIFNTNGQVIYSENIPAGSFTDKHDINLSKQAGGVYYLQITSDQKMVTNKLIVD